MSMIWENGQAVSEKDAGGGIYSKLTITSDGWSGVPIDGTQGDPELRKFQFDIEMTAYPLEDPTAEYHLKTFDYSYGYTRQFQEAHPVIVGISLEHMGFIPYGGSNPNLGENQFLGWNGINSYVGAWGGLTTDTTPTLSAQYGNLNVYGYDYSRPNYTGQSLNVEFANIGTGDNYNALNLITQDIGNWPRHSETTIKTDLPIFATDADLMTYVNSGGTDTSKILNIGGEPTPEEDYEQQFKYWYIKNKWGHNTRNIDTGSRTAKNYRFTPKRKGISFVKHTPTAAEPWDRVLVNYEDYEALYAAWGEDADEDFGPNPGVITTQFLSKSISFGANDYYTRFAFDTNIPLWNTQQDADDYFNGLKDITEADNYAYIARQDAAVLNPDMPGTDIDEATATRTNGMRFSYGVRLYEITNIELSNLMQEMFNPANVEDVIEGNKLMGANTINAVSGVMYLPLADLSEICELGSDANIKIGSWESQQAHGKRIISNEGTIDCGSFFYNPVYLDFRDFEPYNLLFFNGPFVGMHQLTVSKYLNKTVSVKYNIDVCTGGIVCALFADNIMIDVFDGTCGASRPISATDNNAYINSIVSAITGASSQASGSVEGITNSVSAVGKAATTGGALAAGGATLGAVGVAGGVAASGIFTAYQVKNAVDNPPQMHRGSLAGNLAYYLNTKPTFLIFSKKCFRPENEQIVVGYPSGHGGTVGSFSGFLSCSAVKLANGFVGTAAEEAEILEIMKGGVHL